MAGFATRMRSGRRAANACLVAALCGAATVAQPALAQLAGGALAGGGQAAQDNTRFGDVSGRPEPSQCIRHAIDNRQSMNDDDNQVSAWVSVHRPAIATILASGSANGPDVGTFSISVLVNGIPIAHSSEGRGTNILSAHNSTSLQLLPGRQYKITVKAATSRTKRLDLLNLYVGVGKPCL